MGQQTFYIKFILSNTLIANAVTLLDGGHRIGVFIGRFLHKRKQVHTSVKTEFVDESEFALADSYVKTFVVFLNCLLFSSIVPIIPLFGAVYFWIKYFVDKNNMLFVYIQKQESGGQLRNGTKNFMIFNLMFYMIAMSSFYANKIGNHKIFIAGVVITILVYIGLTIYLKTGHHIKVDAHLQEKKMEEGEEKENELLSALMGIQD